MVRSYSNLLIVLAFALIPLRLAAGEVEVPGGGIMRLEILQAEERPQPVAGEMILLKIRAVYDLKIANEKLEIIAGDAFDWIQSRPDHWREEMIDGLPRIVMERELAVWPKLAGPLQFGPVHHRLTVIDRQSQRRDISVTARPLSLSVGEFPASRGWKFSARKLELTDELDADPGALADGQMLTRRVILRALGALPEHLPSRPVVSENWLITFAPPIERSLSLTDQGPLAELVWTWQFRPHTGEPGVLEGVKIPYFNSETRQMEAVEMPSIPMAYASFFTGQTPQGQIALRQKLLLLAGFCASLLAGLGFAALFLQPPGDRRAWARLMHSLADRWNPLLWLRFRRARREGDLLVARGLGERLGLSAEAKAQLDRLLYARADSLAEK